MARTTVYITVTNEKIIKLQACAQGFRNSFFIIYNSMISKEGCESWAQDGYGMSVLGTNGCFSLELYLKFLLVINSFNNSTLLGEHMKGHSLDDLYDELNRLNSTYTTDLENLYSKSKYKYSNKTLRDFLAGIKNYFIDWRYSYDKGPLNVNLNTLTDVLNYMEDYSLKKYLPVSQILAQHQFSTSDDQTMSINNFGDIKKL